MPDVPLPADGPAARWSLGLLQSLGLLWDHGLILQPPLPSLGGGHPALLGHASGCQATGHPLGTCPLGCLGAAA